MTFNVTKAWISKLCGTAHPGCETRTLRFKEGHNHQRATARRIAKPNSVQNLGGHSTDKAQQTMEGKETEHASQAWHTRTIVVSGNVAKSAGANDSNHTKVSDTQNWKWDIRRQTEAQRTQTRRPMDEKRETFW